MAVVGHSLTRETALCSISGGTVGAFLTGLFAQTAVNKDGRDGAFYGQPIQMWYQIAGILTAIGKSTIPLGLRN